LTRGNSEEKNIRDQAERRLNQKASKVWQPLENKSRSTVTDGLKRLKGVKAK